MTRGCLLLVIVAAALAVPEEFSWGHPQGQKPVALIRGEDDMLEVSWVVAPDDLATLAGHLRLPVMPPPDLAGEQSFQSYFSTRVVVTNGEIPCLGSLLSVEAAGRSYSVKMRFDCELDLGRVAIQITLLQDISPDYITLAQAMTPGGRGRGVFRENSYPMTVDFGNGASARNRAPALKSKEPEGRMGRIVALIEGREDSISLLFGLALAFVLGVLHAVTPGHGKTITTAYLVGEGGNFRQAVAMSGAVTLTHSVSVAALGGLAIRLDQLFLPSEWQPWLEVAAGVLIVGMGLSFLRNHIRPHGHSHPHGHGPLEDGLPLRRLALLGLIGGLIPSPEAIAIVLVAFSFGRWLIGVLLVLAFSLGLAAVVLSVALAAVRGGRLIRGLMQGRTAGLVPRIAAWIFLATGLVVVGRGLMRL